MDSCKYVKKAFVNDTLFVLGPIFPVPFYSDDSNIPHSCLFLLETILLCDTISVQTQSHSFQLPLNSYQVLSSIGLNCLDSLEDCLTTDKCRNVANDDYLLTHSLKPLFNLLWSLVEMLYIYLIGLPCIHVWYNNNVSHVGTGIA